jgi:hypothetical protein
MPLQVHVQVLAVQTHTRRYFGTENTCNCMIAGVCFTINLWLQLTSDFCPVV